MPNLRQTIPFLSVADMARSLAYYRDGLGFAIQNQWAPEGQIRCATDVPEETKLSDLPA